MMIVVWRWAGYSAFFALGNSNSFATIDISNSYIGMLVCHSQTDHQFEIVAKLNDAIYY
jgi:hypothetical protein